MCRIFYTEYRYLLGTRGEKPLVCIGINPSTAEPDRLDPTLQSVERVAKNNGYDSFLMFNVYAQRATRPNDMERVCNEALHRANMEAFDYILSLSGAARRVGGVGEHHRAARVSQGLPCRYDRHRRAARRAVVHGGAALGQGTPAPPALPQGDQPAGRVRHPRLLCRMPVGENAKMSVLSENGHFFSDDRGARRGGHFLPWGEWSFNPPRGRLARAEERHGAGRDSRTPPPSSRGAGGESQPAGAGSPPGKASSFSRKSVVTPNRRLIYTTLSISGTDCAPSDSGAHGALCLMGRAYRFCGCGQERRAGNLSIDGCAQGRKRLCAQFFFRNGSPWASICGTYSKGERRCW